MKTFIRSGIRILFPHFLKILLCSFILSCSPSQQYEAGARKAKAKGQLWEFKGAMAMAELDFQTAGSNFTINDVLAKMIQSNSISIFRSCLDSNDWIRVCQNNELWGNRSDEIALYNPTPIYDPRERVTNYCGVNFNGKTVFFKQLPTWK